MSTTLAAVARSLRTRSTTRCFARGINDAQMMRRYSAKNKDDKTTITSDTEWRKQQLNKLSQKFREPLEITSDEELQPAWKDMESRVLKRRTMTLQQRGKSGRANIRPTDEEAWLRAGLYDGDDKESQEP